MKILKRLGLLVLIVVTTIPISAIHLMSWLLTGKTINGITKFTYWVDDKLENL